ncbi:MAG: hypothetical protein AAFV53_06895 [Myxococcota bacterium]
MGLRSRIRRRVEELINRFSGEHSVAAPETTTPYSRPGVPNEDAEVVMARLNRPQRMKPDAAKTRDSTNQDPDAE